MKEEVLLSLVANANVGASMAAIGAIEAEHPRSPKWPEVMHAFRAEHPNCVICGKGGNDQEINIHHVRPYHLFPELELDPSNLITLCNHSLHHLWFGHYGNFRLGYNLAIREDALEFAAKMALRETGGTK